MPKLTRKDYEEILIAVQEHHRKAELALRSIIDEMDWESQGQKVEQNKW